MFRMVSSFSPLALVVTITFAGCANKPDNHNANAASCSSLTAQCECSDFDICVAGACALAAQSCASMGTPDQVISDLNQPGEAFVQLPAPYAQQTCQG